MSLKIRQPAKAPSPGLPGLFLRLLVLAAVGVALAASPAAASPDAVRWTKVNIPAGGETGGWVLASGSDVRHLTASPDGTLYAAAPGLTYTLYRSADGGYTWTHLGKVGDDIVAIAVSPADESRIYYATVAAVFRSTDAGKTFSQLPNGPGGAGAGNVEITSLAVARADHDIVAVGTRDTDSSQFGGVYALDGADIIPAWTDTGLGSYDVYAVAFSPAYPTDRQMVAVMTDETDSFVAGRVADGGWGAAMGNARLNRDNASSPVAVVVTESAAVAFPANYDADPASGLNFLYVAVATGAGTGDVYRISGAPAPNPSPATDLNAGAAYGQGNLDITGLAVYGEYPSAVLLA
ncbi:MAG TPA: hypothetical protein VJ377_04765, partial [Dehalococcoidales bacterium]|nr:hypothetical protein [Dehalococcoidales bacterium]